MQGITNDSGIIYCRVSYADQVDGTSLESQERICREFASREEIEVAEVFVERGESAKTANRTELNRALVFCRKKEIKHFIVYKLDRFSRNQEDHVSVRAILRRHGTELRSATEPIDNTPTGRMMEGVLSAVAQYDNDLRTERCKQGMLERVRQGVWVWPAPLGYRRPATATNIEPDRALAPLIRLAFEEYSKGIYTYPQIAALVSARGLRTQTGRLPTGQTIHKMMRNPLYAGIISVWGKDVVGAFEPIVSRELFERCQPSRAKADIPARSLNNPEFPLRGLLRCSECATTLTGSFSRGEYGGRYPYYHHYFRGCSVSRWVRKEELEQVFTAFLSGLRFDPDLEQRLVDLVTENWKASHRDREQENARLRREITDLEHERQRVFDLHRRGIYSDEDFAEQKKVIGARIQQKAQLIKDAGEGSKVVRMLSECLELLRAPDRTWVELESDYRKRLVFQQTIFASGLLYDGSQLRTELGLIYQLKQALERDESRLVDLLSERWDDLVEELKRWEGLLFN